MFEHGPFGDLNGKVALVTGTAAPKGIGRATALALAELGAKVVVTDLHEQGLAELVQTIEANGGQALGIAADVSEKGQVDSMAKQIEQKFGSVDVLVNNVGIAESVFFCDIKEESWDRMFKNNMKSYFLTTQAVIKPMIEKRWGRIINVSSLGARDGASGFGGIHYASSKAAILGFTRALAREMAQHGITVNSVAPAAIDTDLLTGKMSKDGQNDLQYRQTRISSVAMGRLGKSEEVASVIAFLATGGSFITGAVVDVNGGKYFAP